MPFPFILPTTSSISFTKYLTSPTHPSLPLTATTTRGVLRDTLKRHKRLPPASQASNLPTVLNALNEYIPYLLALDAGLSGTPVACAGGEEVDVVLIKEVEVEWRPTLSSGQIPGREASRVKLKGLDNEVFFVLSTLAYVHALTARAQLHTLYNATLPTQEQRAAAISAAMKSFLEANSVFNDLVTRSSQSPSPTTPSVAELSTPVLSALSSLTLADATLITVLKDDPYPALILEERNKNNKDWMFRSPSIPKVRASLFARLCLAAGEHASKGLAMLGKHRGVDEALPKYLDDLRRTSRAKAARFLGLDAEMEGKVGEGIAWLRGAKKELGMAGSSKDDESSKSRLGLSKLKNNFLEKREDKRIETNSADWGLDAGRVEESRIVSLLDNKWNKENDTIGMQTIPPSEQLLATMPSGREYHSPKNYIPPVLEDHVIARMRAPPDPRDKGFEGEEGDSDDDVQRSATVVGAFPEEGKYGGSTSYY